MTKRVLTVAIGVIMALAVSFVTYADAEPAYAASGISAKVTLTISKGTATIKLNSECKQATKMQATVTLQRQTGFKWVNVKSVKKSTTASKLNGTWKISVPTIGINKTLYRAKATVQATKGKKYLPQTVTVYSKTVRSY